MRKNGKTKGVATLVAETNEFAAYNDIKENFLLWLLKKSWKKFLISSLKLIVGETKISAPLFVHIVGSTKRGLTGEKKKSIGSSY